MGELVESYVDDILRSHPHGPIHLAGHSAGGWYAYEIARSLRRRGVRVGMVALLDSHPAARVPLATSLSMLLPHCRGIARAVLRRFRESSLGKVMRKAWTTCRRSAGGGARTARSSIPDVDRYVALVRAWRSGPYEGTVDFFLASDASGTAVPMWRSLARGGVRVHAVPVEHQWLHRDGAWAIAKVIRDVILSDDDTTAGLPCTSPCPSSSSSSAPTPAVPHPG